MSHDPNETPLQNEVCPEIGVALGDSLLGETAREYIEGPALLSPREITPAEEEVIIERFHEHRSRVAIQLCGYDIFEHS